MADYNKYDKCPVCNQWGFMDIHKCPPLWCTYVKWGTETPEDDEWSQHRGKYEEDVAKLAGEEYDSGEYSLLRGGSVEVLVRNLETNVITQYTVTAEAVPQYYAELSCDN